MFRNMFGWGGVVGLLCAVLAAGAVHAQCTPPDCDDGDECTFDECVGTVCENTDTTPAGQCCDPLTGDLTQIDDSNECTDDTCNPDGTVTHTDTTTPGWCCSPTTGVEIPIDDGQPCTDDVCNPDGSVTHTDIGEITVDIEIEGLSNAVTRDVYFEIITCFMPSDSRVVSVSFDASGQGTAVLDTVDAGSSLLNIREGHALAREVDLSWDTCAATVNLQGVYKLLAGDFQTGTISQDQLVDMTDFSILATAFNTAIDADLSTGADVTGDGAQGTADFTAIQINFFELGDPVSSCFRDDGGVFDFVEPVDIPVQLVPQPKSRVAVEALGFRGAERADLNGDGFVDAKDVRAFAEIHDLPILPSFARKLEALEPPSKAGRVRPSRSR